MIWSWMGAGTLALQVSFVHTHHLYYYCSWQLMAVPRVTQENTKPRQRTESRVKSGYSASLDRGV